VVGAEIAEEEAERVRWDGRAYKERNLSGFKSVPVEEEMVVVPVPGSQWIVIVEDEVEEATWIFLLQRFEP